MASTQQKSGETRRRLKIIRPSAVLPTPEPAALAVLAQAGMHFVVSEGNLPRELVLVPERACGGRHKLYTVPQTGKRYFAKEAQDEQTPADEARVLMRLTSSTEARDFVPPTFALGHFIGNDRREVLLIEEVPGRAMTRQDALSPPVYQAAAKAIAAINRAGVRHLDTKPQHFIVSSSSSSGGGGGGVTVRVIDFGLALIVDPLLPDLIARLHARPFRGNLLFASLFHHFGELADPACDFQAFCIMLALLSGEAVLERGQGIFATSALDFAIKKIRLLRNATPKTPWLWKAKEICEHRVDNVESETHQYIITLCEIVSQIIPGVSEPAAVAETAAEKPGSEKEEAWHATERARTPAPNDTASTPVAAAPSPSPAAPSPSPAASAPSPETATAVLSPATSASSSHSQRLNTSKCLEDYVRCQFTEATKIEVTGGHLPTFIGGNTTQVDILYQQKCTPKLLEFIKANLVRHSFSQHCVLSLIHYSRLTGH